VFNSINSYGLNETSINPCQASKVLPTTVQHNTILEIVWTLIPCVILLLIAVPSFSLLYAVEDLNIIESTIKIIGNQ
jgi:cytochrome c oxidase subunit 2